MICLTLATILQLPLAMPTETYADAHRQTMRTGKPMVVMVGAEWCPACKAMEANVIPAIRQRGLLRRVAFALVDLDRDHEVGSKLVEGGPIPQLIVFRKTANGWRNRRLIGNQSIETVEEFINEDVAANEAEKTATAKKPSAAPAKSQISAASHESASAPVHAVSVISADTAPIGQ